MAGVELEMPGLPILDLAAVEARYSRRGDGGLFGFGGEPRRNTVEGIDLHLCSGETLALVGESGSGKSTLARVIVGLLPLAAGHVSLNDEILATRVEQRRPDQRQAIQLVFQDPSASLNPRRTVLEAIERPLALFEPSSRGRRHERAAELLAAVQLPIAYLARYPAQLSGGERQRVSIARALAASPKVVLCDEVVSALDVSVQAAILDLLVRLQNEQQLAFLFISHDLAVVRSLAHRVAVLFQGRICETGPVEAVFAPPHHPYTAMLLDAVLEPVPGASPRLHGDARETAPYSGHGCVFAPRCSRRVEGLCDVSPPPAQATPAGSTIWCHVSPEALMVHQHGAATPQHRSNPRQLVVAEFA